jgi:hypothetical protein
LLSRDRSNIVFRRFMVNNLCDTPLTIVADSSKSSREKTGK